jgi:hypothetical protein
MDVESVNPLAMNSFSTFSPIFSGRPSGVVANPSSMQPAGKSLS